MTAGEPRDLVRSIHQRLLNESRRRDRPFNELLHYFAMERLLYRLSQSPHRSRFILKGALLFTAWRAPLHRPTRDIDLSGRMSNDLTAIVAAFQEICRQDVRSDGLTFDAGRVAAHPIIEGAEYHGVRVQIYGSLGKARIVLHADISLSDALVPAPVEVDYPTLLDLPAPNLRGCRRETVVAEKFHAMVKLGELNSRMKDFFDIWFLAKHFGFEGPVLSQAVAAVFAHRGTAVPAKPLPLSAAFAELPDKQTQWAAFLRRVVPGDAPVGFGEVVAHVAAFLEPLTQALAAQKPFPRVWDAPGPWRE